MLGRGLLAFQIAQMVVHCALNSFLILEDIGSCWKPPNVFSAARMFKYSPSHIGAALAHTQHGRLVSEGRHNCDESCCFVKHKSGSTK